VFACFIDEEEDENLFITYCIVEYKIFETQKKISYFCITK